MEGCAVSGLGARGFERHRTDWFAVGREPEQIGEKELASGFELDHRSAKRASETTEDFVLPLGGFPFDGVDAERTRHAQRALHAPPCGERVGIEERVEHSRGRCLDGQAVIELFHRGSPRSSVLSPRSSVLGPQSSVYVLWTVDRGPWTWTADCGPRTARITTCIPSRLLTGTRS